MAIQSNLSSKFHEAGYTKIQTNKTYIGGYVRQHGNLSFSRVLQAGHEGDSFETPMSVFGFRTGNAYCDCSPLVPTRNHIPDLQQSHVQQGRCNREEVHRAWRIFDQRPRQHLRHHKRNPFASRVGMLSVGCFPDLHRVTNPFVAERYCDPQGLHHDWVPCGGWDDSLLLGQINNRLSDVVCTRRLGR